MSEKLKSLAVIEKITIPVNNQELGNFAEVSVELEQFSKKYQDRATNIIISDDSGKQQVTEIILKVKKITSALESKRKEIVDPLFKRKKNVDKFFKTYTDIFNTVDSKLRMKIIDYEKRLQEEKRQREKELEEERLATEKRLKNLESVGEDTADLSAESKKEFMQEQQNLTALEERTEQKTQTYDSGTSTTVKKRWTFDIVSKVEFLNDAPNEYKDIDNRAVRSAISKGIRDIPGLRIYQKEEISIKESHTFDNY